MYICKGYPKKVDEQQAVHFLREGIVLREIAEKFGCSRQRIQQISKKFGIYPSKIRKVEKEKKYKAKWGKRADTALYREQRKKWRHKKYNAEKTGYEWNLPFGEIEWPTHCPVLGIELDYFAEFRQENSVSFDRIDSNKGYVSGNVEIVSWRANRIKNDGTWEEHQKIVDYLKKRGNVTLDSPINL
jgi:predicted DNA-binding protein YlxM (UPF0122 family)